MKTERMLVEMKIQEITLVLLVIIAMIFVEIYEIKKLARLVIRPKEE